MWKVLKWALIAIAGLVGAVLAGNSFYFAKPIAGRVLESGTPTPLPGVTVVADWQLQGGMEGGRTTGHVLILETVTDADGRFAFPAWGPRFAYPFKHFEERAPLLLFFKAGYVPKHVENRNWTRGWVLTSDWDGETTLLEPASRYRGRYAAILQMFGSGIDLWFFYHRCVWQSLPHLLLALDQASAGLSRPPAVVELPTLDQWKTAYPECYFDEDFVRRHGQW